MIGREGEGSIAFIKREALTLVSINATNEKGEGEVG